MLCSNVLKLTVKLKLGYLTSLSQVQTQSPISLGCDEFATVLRIDARNRGQTFSWHRKVLACIANWSRTVRESFKHVILFVRQKSSQNRRQVIAYVAKPSRTRRQPFADVRRQIARKFPRSAQCDKYGT